MANIQMPMAQQGQQPAVSPFTPQSAMPVGQQLAVYMAAVKQSSMAGGNQTLTTDQTNQSASQNPWAPDEITPDQYEKQKTNHQQWLETQPVGAQSRAGWSDKTHMNIMRNLENDPLVNEIGENYISTLDVIKAHYQNDLQTLGPQQAHANAMSYIQEMSPMIEEAVTRHHGKHSDTHGHSLTVDPDLHQTPELLKKMKGGR